MRKTMKHLFKFVSFYTESFLLTIWCWRLCKTVLHCNLQVLQLWHVSPIYTPSLLQYISMKIWNQLLFKTILMMIMNCWHMMPANIYEFPLKAKNHCKITRRKQKLVQRKTNKTEEENPKLNKPKEIFTMLLNLKGKQNFSSVT